MELLVLDTDMKAVAVLDSFESLIWTERYSSYGDFEISTKATAKLLTTLKEDYYLMLLGGTDRVMVIEDRKITFDAETGSRIIIKGRSFEAVLDRRLIWVQTVLTGSLQNGVFKLLDENAITPTDTDRIIPGLIFDVSVDEAITALTIESQFTRKNLYDTIQKIAETENIGFKVTLDSNYKFVFTLYAGKDRSYTQIANPYVIFSPEFENLLNGEYTNSKTNSKTLTIVTGEGEGDARITTVVGSGVAYDRRELLTEASDVSQTVNGVLIPEAEYIDHLQQRGLERLAERVADTSFESEVDVSQTFKYEEDFFLGDIVQLVTEFGVEGRARVTEIIRSESSAGVYTYPAFAMIE